jgi:GTP cyclohydrolase II
MNILLSNLASGPLETKHGEFQISVFSDGREECIVLSKGEIHNGEGIYCRLHSMCITGHVFQSNECDCNDQISNSMKLIEQRGLGLVIMLQQEGRGNGAAAHIASQKLKRSGMSQSDAYTSLGFLSDARRYDVAVKILQYFDIKSLVLDTENLQKTSAMINAGIRVCSIANEAKSND